MALAGAGDSEARTELVGRLVDTIMDLEMADLLATAHVHAIAEAVADRLDHVGYDNPPTWPVPWVRLRVPPSDGPTPVWRWKA